MRSVFCDLRWPVQALFDVFFAFILFLSKQARPAREDAIALGANVV